MQASPLGIYLHLPFCERICHYCDFVKTALHSKAQREAYLTALDDRLEAWLQVWKTIPNIDQQISTVFWGGGTPSLLSDELTPIMQRLAPHLRADAEVSLEANPEHINEANLAVWTGLGVNRLSLGIQSFQAVGLKALTREHSPEAAVEAVRLAQTALRNVSIDLIYGWPGQDEKLWEADLAMAVALRPAHISLYSLTYEGQTPFARRLNRGVIAATEDETMLRYYQLACRYLGEAAYLHEEVSNWALPGFFARHNGLYWNGGSYIGLGSGAHGYLETLGPWGVRWKQDAQWRHFTAQQSPQRHSYQGLLEAADIQIEEGRDADAWILEVVSSGLRTAKGINVAAICKKTGYSLVPRAAVKMALDRACMKWSGEDVLILTEEEWFRESSWALELALSFQKNGNL